MPPPILSPRFDAMPAELIALPRWVLWRAVWQADKDKYSKVPYQARSPSVKASSTDPATWATFAEARAAYEADPAPADNPEAGFAGVGFVLSESDPFAGVDLDHVFDESRVLSTSATAVVAALDTYAEVSPSGTGVRLFLVGNLPPGRRKNGDVECYESGRFLTVTGRKLPAVPPTVNERQTQIEAFHAAHFPAPEKPKRTAASGTGAGLDVSDTDLLAVALKAKNGAAVSALYDGNTAGYPGASEADFALCSLLAFYTGDDAGRLDRLFRGSGLMRDKWDARHYADGSTYGEKTIERAIAGCASFYKPRRAKLGNEQVADEAVNASRSATRRNAPPATRQFGVAGGACPVVISAPVLRTEKDAPEYAPYQIAELLGLEAEAPDTQRALAARAVVKFAADSCYVPELGYLHFDGKKWRRDDRQESHTAALFCQLSDGVREEAAVLFGHVAELIKEDRREHANALMRAARRHLTHVKAVETERFAQGAMILARSALHAPLSQFEPRPWVFAAQNGVWERGEWREHKRDDYLLDLAPVTIDRAADRSEWLAVLDRITGGDTDLARTLQETAGYALSGASSLRTLPWLYGVKGSGKSTFAALLQTMLGDMAVSLDVSLLSADAERGRLGASLWGRKLAIVEEAGSQRIDAESLKMLSGGTQFSVKLLYKEAFNAAPRHMLLMVANDPPNMNAYDDALRDRVAAIPCNRSLSDPAPLVFSDGSRIEEVRQNADSALVRGFAAWAMDGLDAVYVSQTIHRAREVEKATAQFWKDTDPLTEFWETQDDGTLLTGIGRGELRQRYQTWAAENCIRKPLSPKVWADACRARGLVEEQIGGGADRGKKVWRLVTLKTSSSPKEGGKNVTAVTLTSPFLGKVAGDSKNDVGDFTENTPNRGYNGYKYPWDEAKQAVADFLAATCDRDKTEFVPLIVLFKAFGTWEGDKRLGEEPTARFALSVDSFAETLTAVAGAGVNISRGGSNGRRVWGLSLRPATVAVSRESGTFGGAELPRSAAPPGEVWLVE